MRGFHKSRVPKEGRLPNLIVCNPPYTRHHHIPTHEKARLHRIALRVAGIDFNGMTSTYGYFLVISHQWLSENGIGCWLVPSDFMNVKYGLGIRKYLTSGVSLIRVHVFDPEDLRFPDAQVTSTVLWFIKRRPPEDFVVQFTFGKSILRAKRHLAVPLSQLRTNDRWSSLLDGPHIVQQSAATLSDFFIIKRGLATGADSFFILKPCDIDKLGIPVRFLKPILPPPRYLSIDEIGCDSRGDPILEHPRYLLTFSTNENRVREECPALWSYLKKGRKRGVHNGYLCSHRKPWYVQEKRDPAVFLCTYMGRGKQPERKPFRFLINHSRALAANSYILMYPKESLMKFLEARPSAVRTLWQALKNISQDTLCSRGRVYGGGLHKLEPSELALMPAEEMLDFLRRGPDDALLEALSNLSSARK